MLLFYPSIHPSVYLIANLNNVALNNHEKIAQYKNIITCWRRKLVCIIKIQAKISQRWITTVPHVLHQYALRIWCPRRKCQIPNQRLKAPVSSGMGRGKKEWPLTPKILVTGVSSGWQCCDVRRLFKCQKNGQKATDSGYNQPSRQGRVSRERRI